MFGYNILSDLIDGTLVKPIKLVDDKVLCIKEDGSEEYYSFSDFDFDKTEEERSFIVIDTPVEPVEPVEPVDPVEPVEPTEPTEPTEPVEQEYEWIENNSDKQNILYKTKFSYKDINKVNIIKSVISN